MSDEALILAARRALIWFDNRNRGNALNAANDDILIGRALWTALDDLGRLPLRGRFGYESDATMNDSPEGRWTTLARRTHHALIDAIQGGRADDAYHYTLGLSHCLLHTTGGY